MKIITLDEFAQQFGKPNPLVRTEFLESVRVHLGSEAHAKCEAEIPITQTHISEEEAGALLKKVLTSPAGQLEQYPSPVLGPPNTTPPDDSDLDMNMHEYANRKLK